MTMRTDFMKLEYLKLPFAVSEIKLALEAIEALADKLRPISVGNEFTIFGVPFVLDPTVQPGEFKVLYGLKKEFPKYERASCTVCGSVQWDNPCCPKPGVTFSRPLENLCVPGHPQYDPPFPYETQENCPHIHDLGPELGKGSILLRCTLLKGHDGDCIVVREGKKWKVTPGGVDDPGYHFPEEVR